MIGYGRPIDISEYVKPTLDACTMEVGSAFLKFTCRRGNNVYEMVAFGEDRSSILYNLFVDSSSRELNRYVEVSCVIIILSSMSADIPSARA